MADPFEGMSPIDRLKLRLSLANQPVSPEQKAANLSQTREDALSVLPVIGNAMSARDAYTGAGEAYDAFGRGDYQQGGISGLLAAMSGLGAVTGLPFGKAAASVAKQAPDMAYAIPAYHGSPHDFDKFDMSKIGTGEGAQSYGHGLYFSENPEVAAVYQKTLGDANLNGSGVDSTTQIYASAKLKGTLDQSEARIRDQLEQFKKLPEDHPNRNLSIRKMEEHLDAINAVRNGDVRTAGRLYHTELDVEPEDLLDWDKPLSQQSEKVKQGIREFYGHSADEFDRIQNISGGEWMRGYSGGIPRAEALDTNADISAALREAGIPGIRYLDQGSRGAGQGSSNYVIFDDNLVKVLRKE